MNTEKTPIVIALCIVAAFIALIPMMIFHPPASTDQAIMAVINMLLGALVAKFTTIVDFYFGSSKNNQNKDDTIRQLAMEPDPSKPPSTPTNSTSVSSG